MRRSRRGQHQELRAPRRRWQWLVPGFAPWFLFLPGVLPILSLELLVAGSLAIVIMVLGQRFKAPTLRLLFVLLPFTGMAVAWLHALGVPGPIVRPLGLWKEIAVLLLFAGGIVALTRTKRRFDALDWLAIGYLVIGTLYLFLPQLFLGSDAPERQFGARLTGWRTDVIYVALFFGARHIRFTGAAVSRAARALTWAGAAVAVIAVFEYFYPRWWYDFIVDTVGWFDYRTNVLQADELTLQTEQRLLRGRLLDGSPRSGSVILSATALGAFLLPVLAVAVESTLSHRSRARAYFALVPVVLGIAFTQSRAPIAAAGLVLLLILRPHQGRDPGGQTRTAMLLVAGLAVMVPFLVMGGVTERFSGVEQSDASHEQNLYDAVETILTHPMGTGLATGAASGEESDVAENQYFQIGTQLGIAGMVLFTAACLLAVRNLRRAAAAADGDPEAQWVALGARGAFIGLLLVGIVSQPFISYPVGWITWGLVGAALGAAERAAAESGAPGREAPVTAAP